jgi:hypothetical protein
MPSHINRGSTNASHTKAAPSNSAVLHAFITPARERLYAVYRRFWTHPHIGKLVPDFLVLMHQIIRASLSLMNTAQVRAAQRRSHGVSQLLAAYLTQHIEEERHHDEWLLEDLETAGMRRSDILKRMPLASVASLVGAQYYWIQHHDPVSLLGYMRVLEGNPPSPSHIDNLQRQSGLPASVFRTYRMHGELDPNHRRELDLFIDSLPLTKPQTRLVSISAAHTAQMLAECLKELEPSTAERGI